MSIASEITRLQGAKASIKSAIEAKGVTVPSNALLDSFATYIAQISGGGSTGLEYETGTYTPAQDIAVPTINFSNTHSTPPSIVIMSDATNTYDSTSNSNVFFCYVYAASLLDAELKASTSSTQYGFYLYKYRGTNSTSFSTTQGSLTFSSSNPDAISQSYPRYWVNESCFKPQSLSTSRYWRANRTYKWIAIWK